ncbi:MAG: hypothetical protein NC394_05885 [Bacteroides sp.]|nr:hypothetical protein [Bacteroides sp.]
MNFSELKALTDDTGLSWDDGQLCLCGAVKDYPVYIADLRDSREYLLTVFRRTRADTEQPLIDGVNRLLDGMPKNCVNGRRDEPKFLQIRFNAAMLYQENGALLSGFVLKLCELLDGLDILPAPAEPSSALPQKAEPVRPNGKSVPKNAVSKGFDKYSIRGLAGAVIGGAAMAVISSTMASADPDNVGAMIASWAAGALIALVTLADYSFLARKIDIFGAVACSFVTALSCFFCSMFGIMRIMTNTAKADDASVTFNAVARSWSVYSELYPDTAGYAAVLLVKNIFTALLASIVFYILYYRRHQAIMYAEGGSFLTDEELGTKKRKNKRS